MRATCSPTLCRRAYRSGAKCYQCRVTADLCPVHELALRRIQMITMMRRETIFPDHHVA